MSDQPEILPERRSSTELTLTKLSVDFQYIQRDISEIKKDVKDIKNDTISRREFEEYKKDTDKRVSFITGVMYTIGSTIILAFLGAVINLVINK